MLAQELDGLGTASTQPTVDEHVAVVGDLVEPPSHLGERDQPGTGNVLLLLTPMVRATSMSTAAPDATASYACCGVASASVDMTASIRIVRSQPARGW